MEESKFKHQDIIELIKENKLETAKAKINEYYPVDRNFLKNIFKKKDKEVEELILAYKILNRLLSGKQNLNDLSSFDFGSTYISDYAELGKLLFEIEDLQVDEQFKQDLAHYLYYWMQYAARHIAQNSNDYPQNSISGNIWMDGYVLRSWAQALSEYFEKQKNDEYALDMSLEKARITCSIMSHYPELVGPDMISVASKYEAKGAISDALNFYRPVLADFVEFLEDIEFSRYEDNIGEMEQDPFILNALIDAVEGLQRLDNYVDEENYIDRAKKLLG